MIDRAHSTLSISRQCALLDVSRATVYRLPRPVSAEDLRFMEMIDRQYLARPYYGSRRMAAWLVTQGHVVNRKRVQRLMRLMGLVAIYQRPNTSKPAPEHPKYPYLLGGLSIERANQGWCSDVTVRVNANETAGLGVQARSACVISGVSELVAASVCLQDAGGLRSRKALPSRPSGRVPREGPCPPSRAPAWGKAGRDGGMAALQPNNGMTGMGISSPSGRPAG